MEERSPQVPDKDRSTSSRRAFFRYGTAAVAGYLFRDFGGAASERLQPFYNRLLTMLMGPPDEAARIAADLFLGTREKIAI